MSEEHRVCPAERAGSLTGRLRSLIHDPVKILSPYLGEGDTVLDFGCGPGFFTCAMAEMVGERGKVIAVDLQEEMLGMLRKRAVELGILSRIEMYKAETDAINVNAGIEVDFALAFYVVHEVPDKERLFREIHELLRQGGKLLVIEPAFHVKKDEFERTLGYALENGFELIESSKGFVDMRALLRKTGDSSPLF